tara:strand:- start:220 stop:453 length:234 start_codon:yes stop_codon:yes gene_type:complete
LSHHTARTGPKSKAARQAAASSQRRQRVGVAAVVVLALVGVSAAYLAWRNNLSVQAAEVEEANRRVVSKSRGFARLS